MLHKSDRAEVHEAVHSGLERRVVAKILPDVVDQAALLRQARALASFSHPHAARVLEAGLRGAAGAGAFLVRELVEGVPLSALISAKGPLDATLTIRLGAQLLSALSGAHTRGLIHGQLRPEHLIVSRSGLDRERLVVIDFAGVDGGPLPVRPGRHQLSPELARGEPPTASSDLYAAGAVLYQCLSGAPPFDGQDDVTLFYRAAHEDLPFTGAPAFELESVRAFFGRALSKRPEGRFESAKEMLGALLALPFAALAAQGEADASPFDPLAEPWLTPSANVGTGTHTGLRAQTQALLADNEPTLWVLTGDPAIRSEVVAEALEAIRQEMEVVLLDEAQREQAIADLEAGRVELPWIVLFGDLHVLLGEPLLARLGACGEISRVLVSTHANVELLQSTINSCGLDQQVCMPFEAPALIGALRTMAKRSASLHRHYDRLRHRLRDARDRASVLSRAIAAVPLSPEGNHRS